MYHQGTLFEAEGGVVLFMYGGQVLEHTSAERFFDTPTSSQARAFIRGELVW